MNRKYGWGIGVIALVVGLVFIAGYGWKHMLSHGFRTVALEALVELDSFREAGACSGAVVYGLGAQRTSFAVNKAEKEVLTSADRRAAEDLRSYHDVLTERDKNCDVALKTEFMGQYLRVSLYQDMVYHDLGLKWELKNFTHRVGTNWDLQ